MSKPQKLTKKELKKCKDTGMTDGEINQWLANPDNQKWLKEERAKQKIIRELKSKGLHFSI